MIYLILQLVSWLVLAIGVVMSPILFYADRIHLDTMKNLMLAATVVWFALTPFWINRAPQT